MSMVSIKLDEADIRVAVKQYLLRNYKVDVDAAGLRIEMRMLGSLVWEKAILRLAVEVPSNRDGIL